MLQGIFGCSDHGRGELEILRAGRRTCSKLTASSALDFRRANFGLFKDLTGRVP